MRWTFHPTQRFKDRAGQVTVAVLLAVAFLATGCGDKVPEKGVTLSQSSDRGEAVPRTPIGEPTVPVQEVSHDTPETPLETEPVFVDVTFVDAEKTFREKKYDDAVGMFTVFTEQHPKNIWGFYMLGLSAWKSGDHVTAESSFERALELDGEHVKSLVNLSRVLLDEDRPEDALTRVERAQEIDGQNGEVHRLLGRVNFRLGNTDEAIRSYRQAIMLDADDAWAMNNLGYALITQERFGEALPALARATELREDVASFYNNLGVALERGGYLTASAEAFRTALALDETYDRAAVNLGRVDGKEDRPGLIPVDLEQLARRFEQEIEGWRQPVVAEEPEVPEIDEPVETQPTGIPMDSTGTRQH